MKISERLWGFEERLINNELYCGKILNLKKNHQSSIQWHKNKDESFYVMEGKVKLKLLGETKYLNKGDSVRIKPYTIHQFIGLENSRILEVSTTHKDEDTYYVLKGGKV